MSEAEEVAKLQATTSCKERGRDTGRRARSVSARAGWMPGPRCSGPLSGIPLAWGVWKTLESADQDLLTLSDRRGDRLLPSRGASPIQSSASIQFKSIQRKAQGNFPMLRKCNLSRCHAARRRHASYRLGANDGSGDRHGKALENEADRRKAEDMKAKWSANKGKLKACRVEVKQKGLAGDDR